MKSKFVKKTLTLVLCIAMLSSNLAFAEGSVSGDAIEQHESSAISLLEEDNNTEVNEEETSINEEETNPNEAEQTLEEPEENNSDAGDKGTSDNSISENSINEISASENSVSENSVSGNSVSENSIANLKKTEDGTSYILNKTIEKRNIIISLFIPVSLFPEAKEIYFDAIEAKEEVKESFEETVNEDMQNEKLINDTELFDITLFVNNQKVTKFDENIIVTFEGDDVPATTSNETVEVFHFDEEKEEVENLSDQVTITDEKIEFETDHFSLYGYVKAVTRDYSTREGILNALGVSRFFSVFAKEFQNTTHMEGNIAVDKLFPNANITMTNSKITNSARDFKLKIIKEVMEDSKGGTFYFSVYDTEYPNGEEPVLTTSLDVGSGQKVTSNELIKNDGELFSGNKIYYIFETDEDYNILGKGKRCKANSTNYEVVFSSNIINENIVSSIGTASYVNKLAGNSQSNLFSSNDTLIKTRVVFGDENSFSKDQNGIIRQISNQDKIAPLDTTNSEYYIANGKACIDGQECNINYGDFPIDFSNEFSSLKDVSKDLVSIGNNPKVIEIESFIPMKHSNSRKGTLNTNDFSCDTDNLLVINVNCSGIDNLDWDSRCSNWVDNAWGNESGKNSNYSNVIWNFYKREYNNSKHSYSGRISAYNGVINTKQVACGTIFAPDATVTIGSDLAGAVIAKRVNLESAEIHEILLSENPDSRVIDIVCKNKEIEVNEPKPINLDVQKSALLKDWDDRTYDISLQAKADVSEYTQPQDIVLVLDCSSSMKNPDSKFENLKAAVIEFLNTLNGNNRIAVVTFNSQVNTIQNLSTLNTVKSTLIDKINGLTTTKQTRMDLGLDEALNVLVENTDQNPQNMILFTDGEPTQMSGGGQFTSIRDKVELVADEIDNYNIPIYTIGLELTQSSANWLQQEIATSNNYAYISDNSSDLLKIFSDLAKTISNKDKDVVIKDYIDARFDLVAENGTVYSYEEVKDATQPITVYGGTLSVSNLQDYTDQRLLLTITKKLSDLDRKNESNGWKQSIVLKAKNDFIGGNAIPTNGDESGVIVAGEDIAYFNVPEVNVKVRFDAGEASSTIFWGEKLFGNRETVSDDEETINYLTDSKIEELLYKLGKNNVTWTKDGETLDLYDYNNRGKMDFVEFMDNQGNNRFTANWYRNCEVINGVPQYRNLLDIEEMKKVNKLGNYYVEFAYTGAGEVSDKSIASCTVDSTLYMAETANSIAYGKYTVSIITGDLTISKKIDDNARKEVEGDPIFTFKISEISNKNDNNSGKVYYKTLRFSDSKSEETVTITGLPKGIYKVEELNTMGFVENQKEVIEAETDCKYAENVFYIGYQRDNISQASKTFKAIKGKICISNFKRRKPGKLTDTDAVKNTFVINETGTDFVLNGKETDVDNGETQQLKYPIAATTTSSENE